MNPNQQPNRLPPQTPGNPQPYAPPQPAVPSQPPSQSGFPQPPSSYAPSVEPSYNPNYLDTIAPPPPRANFLSGSFGKIFFALIGLFVIAVSIIIASNGRDETADLQQVTVRLQHIATSVKTARPNLKSSNLITTNSNFQTWTTGNAAEAENLLKVGGVQKTDYNRDMVASEKSRAETLDAKLEDARLSARLDRVYANTMAAEAETLVNMLDTMNRKSKSSQIRDFAKNASTNLKPIQKSFADYTDDGN